MSSLILARIDGEMVKYFEDNAKMAEKTFNIF
jgi:hypothetical protein